MYNEGLYADKSSIRQYLLVVKSARSVLVLDKKQAGSLFYIIAGKTCTEPVEVCRRSIYKYARVLRVLRGGNSYWNFAPRFLKSEMKSGYVTAADSAFFTIVVPSALSPAIARAMAILWSL